MKTQQRSFVVEYKSGRRQITKQPSSIWGDTNFKELVKQAEAESPRLFEQGQTAEAPIVPSASPIDAASPAEPAVAHVEVADLHVSTATVDDEELLEATAPTAVYTSPEVEKASPKRRLRKISRHQPNDANLQDDVQPSEVSADVAADELDLLENENRRLKALLTERLLQQNIQLRGMLERFTVA